MKNKRKIVSEIVIYILFVAILAVGTPKALSYFLGTEYPVASITSGSMWPALKKYDIVFIKNAEKSELEVGDIIVYKNGNSENTKTPIFTIHRIVELNKNTVKTKGDANNISDPLIEYKSIVGKTVNIKSKPLRIPYLGKITSWAFSLK